MPTENRSSNTEMVSVPFQLEDRYIVIKRSDLALLSPVDSDLAHSYLEGVRSIMETWDCPVRECLVVESDWPEYEPTWAAIKARVTGQPAEQHQGEPVAYLITPPGCSPALVHARDISNPSKYAVPLYTHVDPGEVEQLRTELAGWKEQCHRFNDDAMEWREEHDDLRAQLAERDALLGAIAGWTAETRAAVLEAFQDELNESASYAWYDDAIADLMKLIESLSASAEPSEVACRI